MHQTSKKRIAAKLWPRYSFTVEHLNYNARLFSWINKQSVPSFPSRFELYSYLAESLATISYLEFGVWKGDSIRRWSALNHSPESRFFGFDSFEGLPEEWHHGRGGSTSTAHFNLSGDVPCFDDPRIIPVRGWFQRTMPDFLKSFERNGPMVINNDSDLYSSTIYVLSKLDEIVLPGDLIVFDEFSSPANEFKAWTEYTNAFMRKTECIGMSNQWSQVAFRFL